MEGFVILEIIGELYVFVDKVYRIVNLNVKILWVVCIDKYV